MGFQETYIPTEITIAFQFVFLFCSLLGTDEHFPYRSPSSTGIETATTSTVTTTRANHPPKRLSDEVFTDEERMAKRLCDSQEEAEESGELASSNLGAFSVFRRNNNKD